MSSDLKQILMFFIVFLVVVILTVILVTVCRRALAFRRYRILDRLREKFGEKIRHMLDKGMRPEAFTAFSFRKRSLEWQAVEFVLMALVEEKKYEAAGTALFEQLGYRLYYEEVLKKQSIIERSVAADKLGKMRCEASVVKLVFLLEEDNPELACVAIRALSKIGTQNALKSVLRRVPGLYSRLLVTRKSIEQALLNFGLPGAQEMVRAGEQYDDPVAKAFVLEVLGDLKFTEALPFALRCLEHQASEVRSKALKLIGAAGGDLPAGEKEKVEPLLEDPVWFVRLNAAKAVGALGHCAKPAMLAKRMMDEKWQVRNAAATAVIVAVPNPAEVFLETLSATDPYAKESICEEIQKTGFMYRLIENLDPPGTGVYETSRKILGIMASVGYGTPLTEYMKNNAGSGIAKELASIVTADKAGAAR